jgi:hypothetical protein
MKLKILNSQFLICNFLALALLASFAATKARQDKRPAPRIDVILHSSNAATADKLIKDIDKELKKAAKKDDKRNRDLLLVTNAAGSFTVSGTTFLTDTNEADAFIATIIGFAKPAQMSGVIVIHHCPDDTDPDYRDWAGCKDDARASHREVKFP